MIALDHGALASEHLRSSLVRGTYFLPLLSNVVMVYACTDGHWHGPSELDWLTPLAFVVGFVLYGMIGTLIGIFILGIPALLAGLLRLYPMRWLFQLSIGRPPLQAYLQMLAGTFLLFEASVLLTVSGWLSWAPAPAYQTEIPATLFYETWLKVSILSAPWLLSSLYASWKLIRPAVGHAAGSQHDLPGRASSANLGR